MIIRIILILSALSLAVLALRSSPTSQGLAWRRIGLIAFTIGWIVAVLAPDALTELAEIVGVGRGTDLLLYALVVGVAFAGIAIHKRIAEQDERIATLTRALAIAQAHKSMQQEDSGASNDASESR